MGELDATEGQKDVATAVRGPGEAAIKAEYLLPVNRGRPTGDAPLDPAASGATKRARLCESAGAAAAGCDVAGGATEPTETTDPARRGQVADRDRTSDAHYSAPHTHSASSNRDKKDKHRGRNKQRPGMARQPAGQKLCPVLKDVLQSEPPARCTFKGECHFLHDLAVYMAAKPADLGDGCYMYTRHGRCPAGLTCRFGASHTSAAYRSLAGDAALWQTYQTSRPSRNQLAKPVQRSLWKRKYDFSAANAAVSRHDRRPAGARGRSGAGAGHRQPATAAAEQASAPEAGAGVKAAQAPEAVNGAEPTPASQAVAGVEAAPTLEVVTGAEVATQPEAVAGAEVATQPEVVAGAEVATQPEAVAGVEAAPTPEVVAGAEVATQPEAVAGVEAAPTPEAVAGAEDATKPEDVNRVDITPRPEIEEIRRLHVTEEAVRPEPVTEHLRLEQPRMVDASETTHLGPVSDTDLVRQRLSEKKKVMWQDQLYLAPLTTVGNLPFRRLCRRLGADITCGEMAMASNLLQGSQAEWALVRRHSSETVFGAQICGNNPGVLTRCAQLLNEQCQLDFIDINLGCPIELVFEQGGGAAMMRKRSMLENACRSICDVIDIPLTLKMRTGVLRGVNLAKPLLTAAGQWGVSMVTLHGRSREQRYTKLADWSYVAECAQAASPLPVFGNGDVLSWEEYQAKRSASGVAGIVVARGALIKPWIFTEIKESRTWDISSSERLELLKEYTNYGMEHWGSDTEGVEKTRRFLLEWLSFLYRYIPAGLLEAPPQRINERPPAFRGRDHLETMMASADCRDWIAISEMLLGKVPEDFEFLPKHKANSYS